jgi:hypothetical protein
MSSPQTPKTLLVTAYYPIPTGKHSPSEYDQWIRNFFASVTCPTICFCPQSIYENYKHYETETTKFIVREFSTFEAASQKQMVAWKSLHETDPERHLHSPELYAIWSAKQEFVLEAMALQDADTYVWCDIGCFRFPRDGSFKNTNNYIVPKRLTCLSICDTIGGGVLAGDKEAWLLFSYLYLKELEKNPCGKDQTIYKRILNENNATIIPAQDTYNNQPYDPWFYLTYLFSF